jgi:hypothetical protein
VRVGGMCACMYVRVCVLKGMDMDVNVICIMYV